MVKGPPPVYMMRRKVRHRPLYLILTTAEIAVLGIVFVTGCTPLRSKPDAAPVAVVPPQGLYESCPPREGARCLERLRLMAAAGFQYILNYAQLDGTSADELAYAQEAHLLGMKIIWPLHDPVFWSGTDLRSSFRELARTCGCADDHAFITYIVDLIKPLPATWGYYIGDEVPSAEHAKMKAFADIVARLDSAHPRLDVSAEDPQSMGANLAPFADTADVIGSDYYPIGRSQPINATGTIAAAIQHIAVQENKRSVMVLQTFSWAEYPYESSACSPYPQCARFPTRAEMRRMRDLAIQHAHPILLLWYSFFDVLRSDVPSMHWGDLISAAGLHYVPLVNS